MTGDGAIGSDLFSTANRPEHGWFALAACTGMTDSFFVDRVEGVSNQGVNTKPVCQGCVVRERCLMFALENNETSYGIWGGAGGDYLRPLRRLYVEHGVKEHEIPTPGLERHEFDEAFVAHFGRLDGDERYTAVTYEEKTLCPRCGRCHISAGTHPIDRNGPGARCGKVVTFNRGCRCDLCEFASIRRARRRSAKGFELIDESEQHDERSSDDERCGMGSDSDPAGGVGPVAA